MELTYEVPRVASSSLKYTKAFRHDKVHRCEKLDGLGRPPQNRAPPKRVDWLQVVDMLEQRLHLPLPHMQAECYKSQHNEKGGL